MHRLSGCRFLRRQLFRLRRKLRLRQINPKFQQSAKYVPKPRSFPGARLLICPGKFGIRHPVSSTTSGAIGLPLDKPMDLWQYVVEKAIAGHYILCPHPCCYVNRA